jgi:hypothetical protein
MAVRQWLEAAIATEDAVGPHISIVLLEGDGVATSIAGGGRSRGCGACSAGFKIDAEVVYTDHRPTPAALRAW